MRSVSDSSWFSRGWGARALATAVLLVLMVFVAACDSSSDSTGETSASGETSGTAEGEPVSGGTLTFARGARRRGGAEPDQRSQQRLDLHDPADLRPTGRGRGGRRAGSRPGRILGHLRGRSRVDLPSARGAVLQRRPGDRRGRQVLDRALRRSGDQRRLRALGAAIKSVDVVDDSTVKVDARARSTARSSTTSRCSRRRSCRRRSSKRSATRSSPRTRSARARSWSPSSPAGSARCSSATRTTGARASPTSTASSSSSSPTPTPARSQLRSGRGRRRRRDPLQPGRIARRQRGDHGRGRRLTEVGLRSCSTTPSRRSTRPRCARRSATRRPRSRSWRPVLFGNANRRQQPHPAGQVLGRVDRAATRYDIDKAQALARRVERPGRVRYRARDPLGRRGREADGRDHQGGVGEDRRQRDDRPAVTSAPCSATGSRARADRPRPSPATPSPATRSPTTRSRRWCYEPRVRPQLARARSTRTRRSIELLADAKGTLDEEERAAGLLRDPADRDG